ncbi:MAG: nucleotidyltransferase family protein [Candidatus Omnitrophica bacterium]|nr:nucleotidyltransferase family protein [Candidatus Omnitrophota bacterium]
MNYQNVFQLISDIAKNTGVSFILIGGFAVNYYKYTRQTADVDFLITKESFQKISGLLEAEGYKVDYSQEVFVRLISIKEPALMDIDFIFVDKDVFDKIAKDSQRVILADCEFKVPSLEHLIALKLHAVKYNPKLRLFKDLPDIVNLIRINNVDAKSEKFKELCLKYATPEIYQKILEAI